MRVTNTGPTAWPDTAGWRLVEERIIAPAEGSPGEFSEISGVVADAAGNVFVCQRNPALVRVYGPKGTWLRDIGREGDGPGEYRSGMFGIHADTLFVQDPNNTRLTTFRTSGEFVASHASQCCWWTSNFPVFNDGTVGIMGPPPASAKDRQGALYLTHLNGIVADTIFLPVREDRPDDDSRWATDESSKGLYLVFGAGVTLVLLAVAMVFNSVWAAGMVFLSLPTAIAGVVAAFWITGTAFTREAAVGVILVVGLAVHQAILLLDAVLLAQRRHGGRISAADIVRATRDRSTMIVLVTLTTLASLIPMAWGTATDTMFGAIALATAGGTVAGTIGAMFLLPPILLGFRRATKRRRRAHRPIGLFK